ncbi:hypothetical protein CDD83_8742 [Cordyceps sp. RAO-2017]|nr:hypothetical protein CDD83_8742 [Cordyceps sp. RAO-2017]
MASYFFRPPFDASVLEVQAKAAHAEACVADGQAGAEIQRAGERGAASSAALAASDHPPTSRPLPPSQRRSRSSR